MNYIDAEVLRRVAEQATPHNERTAFDPSIDGTHAYTQSALDQACEAAKQGRYHLELDVPQGIDLSKVHARLDTLGFTISTPNMIGSRELILSWEPFEVDKLQKRENVLHMKHCRCPDCLKPKPSEPRFPFQEFPLQRSQCAPAVMTRTHEPVAHAAVMPRNWNHCGGCTCSLCR